MPLDRRTFLRRSAATGASLTLTGAAATPALAGQAAPEDRDAAEAGRYSFTVLGTTDLHGNVFNWDYTTGQEYDDEDHNDVGLAKISTLVEQVRAERGRRNTLLIDAGDTIQGTQLAYYYARVDPITAEEGPVHPMARAMNAMGYRAAALGNHEFNYGVPLLRRFAEQCRFPLLGANVLDARTGRPAFPPYVVERLRTPHGRDVRVAILGLTNPGVAVWDKAHVDGRLTFPGLPEQAAAWVPRLRSMGADVVVVAAHSGTDGTSSYGDQLPYTENAATLVAEQVPGIDAILVGHAHVEIPERVVVNERTGRPVVLSEPLKWGQRLTRFDIDLQWSGGRWTVRHVAARVLDSNTVDEDPTITRLLAVPHRKVVAYVNQVVATSKTALDTSEAPYKDVPLIDLINRVQTETVRDALAGGRYADLPVLSQAPCFSRSAKVPAGDVTIKDTAALYPFDNTLQARLLTGAQVRAYLEHSARYFVRTAPDAPVDPAKLTNAENIPDFNYDAVSGVTYDIDISQPAGSRITNLRSQGEPVDDDAQFVLAINNYRAAGGGNYPHAPNAEQLWSSSEEIRDMLIAWVQKKGTLDPADFFTRDWRLTREGTPVFDDEPALAGR